ncbi:SEL1-like repeat protein, partial [Enterobacter sp. Bisph1]|uniref:SEL1-like repeat protein n=1 Tax=Enterobacter sp. Bisph1 TaxID=1274399 RepID=UPI00057BF71E
MKVKPVSALLGCLLLAGCDQPPPVRAVPAEPLTDINIRQAFTCRYETLPEPAAEADVLFKYARWLQVNNRLQDDKSVDTEVGRLYRIAAENAHTKATINLLNGSLRGRFGLTGGERLRFAQQLIKAKVASGYYFIAIYLQYGAAGLKQDDGMALRYYRKAADEGNPQAQAYVG